MVPRGGGTGIEPLLEPEEVEPLRCSKIGADEPAAGETDCAPRAAPGPGGREGPTCEPEAVNAERLTVPLTAAGGLGPDGGAKACG